MQFERFPCTASNPHLVLHLHSLRLHIPISFVPCQLSDAAARSPIHPLYLRYRLQQCAECLVQFYSHSHRLFYSLGILRSCLTGSQVSMFQTSCACRLRLLCPFARGVGAFASYDLLLCEVLFIFSVFVSLCACKARFWLFRYTVLLFRNCRRATFVVGSNECLAHKQRFLLSDSVSVYHRVLHFKVQEAVFFQ